MAKSLLEYADWLAERTLIWPVPPQREPACTSPRIEPLPGIRAVTWSVYGTLLRITDGELLFEHPQQLRMQIALEKTIREFNMWNSMSRKPGAPWKYMLHQYQELLANRRLSGTMHKGDVPEVDAVQIWRKLLRRLQKNGYEYDVAFYGDLESLSEKVAYFFHSCLQGLEAAPDALRAVLSVAESYVRQGLLADAQPFTLVQILRAFREQGTLPPLADLLTPHCTTLSYQQGVRKPSKSLYLHCLEQFGRMGIPAGEVLHVGTQFQNDLLAAQQAGMRTALYAADHASFRLAEVEMEAAGAESDRVITELTQIREILTV